MFFHLIFNAIVASVMNNLPISKLIYSCGDKTFLPAILLWQNVLKEIYILWMNDNFSYIKSLLHFFFLYL